MTRCLLAALVLCVLCGTGACLKTSASLDPALHRKEIEKWQMERAASLKKDDGWLSLVGLYWLEPGENKFGSEPPMRFPCRKTERQR